MYTHIIIHVEQQHGTIYFKVHRENAQKSPDVVNYGYILVYYSTNRLVIVAFLKNATIEYSTCYSCVRVSLESR